MEIELTKEMLLYGKEVAKQEREHERKRILEIIDDINIDFKGIVRQEWDSPDDAPPIIIDWPKLKEELKARIENDTLNQNKSD